MAIIQVIGTNKCKDTQKVLRYLKERNIPFQLINLQIKGLSPGELKKIALRIPIDELINKNGKEYERLNLKYMKHDPETVLLEYPLLLNTPIIRMGDKAWLGFDPETMKIICGKQP